MTAGQVRLISVLRFLHALLRRFAPVSLNAVLERRSVMERQLGHLEGGYLAFDINSLELKSGYKLTREEKETLQKMNLRQRKLRLNLGKSITEQKATQPAKRSLLKVNCLVDLVLEPSCQQSIRAPDTSVGRAHQKATLEVTRQDDIPHAQIKLLESIKIPIHEVVATVRTFEGWTQKSSRAAVFKLQISFSTSEVWDNVSSLMFLDLVRPKDQIVVLCSEYTLKEAFRDQQVRLSVRTRYNGGRNITLGPPTPYELNVQIAYRPEVQHATGTEASRSPQNNLTICNLDKRPKAKATNVLKASQHSSSKIRVNYHLKMNRTAGDAHVISYIGPTCFLCKRTIFSNLEHLQVHMDVQHGHLRVDREDKENSGTSNTAEVHYQVQHRRRKLHEGAEPKQISSSQAQVDSNDFERVSSTRSRDRDLHDNLSSTTLSTHQATDMNSNPKARVSLRSSSLPNTARKRKRKLDSEHRKENSAFGEKDHAITLKGPALNHTSRTLNHSTQSSKGHHQNDVAPAPSPGEQVFPSAVDSPQDTGKGGSTTHDHVELRENQDGCQEQAAQTTDVASQASPMNFSELPDVQDKHHDNSCSRLSVRTSLEANATKLNPAIKTGFLGVDATNASSNISSESQADYLGVQNLQVAGVENTESKDLPRRKETNHGNDILHVEDRLQKEQANYQPQKRQLPEEANFPLRMPKRRKLAVPHLPQGRTIFRVNSRRPVQAGEILSDSEDEPDTEWVVQKHRDTINAIPSLSQEEKVFANLWNEHFHNEKLLADKDLPAALKRFSELCGPRIGAGDALRREFLSILAIVRGDGLITDADILTYVRIVEKYKGDGADHEARIQADPEPNTDYDQCGLCRRMIAYHLKGNLASCTNPVSPTAYEMPPSGLWPAASRLLESALLDLLGSLMSIMGAYTMCNSAALLLTITRSALPMQTPQSLKSPSMYQAKSGPALNA